jgi:hypothetical protein
MASDPARSLCSSAHPISSVPLDLHFQSDSAI